MNIVFDKWDKNSNPIPNFNYLNEKVVCDAITYPVFLNDLYLDTPIKHYKVEDMNKNENFYYIIQHMYSYQHFLKNGIVNFSNEIKNAITNKNLKVMFVSPHESPEYLEMFIVILNKMIVDNNWDENQFYIINNNSLIYKIKEKLNSNINFYKINSLIKFPSIDITIKPKIYMRNEINIVFDKWDENDTPIQNLQELDDKNGKYTIIYPYFLQELDIKYCKINKCKLSDIKPDKNFYYIIGQTHTYSMFHDNEKIYLPAEVEYHITNNNLKVIYLADHESPPDLNPFVNVLSNHIKKNNWKESNFYIMSNNSMLYDLKDKLNSGINFYKTNTLLKLVSNDLKVKPAEIDIMYDKKFIFLCQNRRPKAHRLLLLTYLDYIGLLDLNMIDWSLTYGKYNDYKLEISVFDNEITKLRHELIKSYFKITDKPRLCYFEKNETWFNNVDDYSQCNHISIKTFQESYVNIITESHYDILDIHITEKSFKPFYYFQMPLFFASYHHVKKLKEEYGLFLFDDLIDHSYDNEIDDSKRFHMVIDEIKRLSLMKDEIKTYYENNINLLIKNYEYIETYKEKNVIGNFFISLTKIKKFI